MVGRFRNDADWTGVPRKQDEPDVRFLKPGISRTGPWRLVLRPTSRPGLRFNRSKGFTNRSEV